MLAEISAQASVRLGPVDFMMARAMLQETAAVLSLRARGQVDAEPKVEGA